MSKPVTSKKKRYPNFFDLLGPTRHQEPAPPADITDLERLCTRLVAQRTDPIGIAVATKLQQAYESLTPEGRSQFFDLLLDRFGVDSNRIIAAAHAYEANPGFDSHRSLVKAVESPRIHLFRSINLAPGGTGMLVRMREHLLEQSTPRRVRLREVEQDLKQLLQSWFNRGFLQLKRIDWDSPASLLEKIISYEAVHEITGWEDLRRRLEDDRRCFGFFHPSLPEEPLVFVEVALTDAIAQQIQELIDRDSPVRDTRDARTAMFYSISNCQTGLRGISFGGFLIKQVVEELRRELPQLEVFSTLSPVPGFRTWLSQKIDDSRRQDGVGKEAVFVNGPLQQNEHWYQDCELRESLRAPLMRLCAHYLVHEKLDGFPIDPVARFHLGNGASLDHMNWLADLSPKGRSQSAGIMVNYVYRIEMIEEHHDAYIKQGVVAATREIQQLAAPVDGD